MKRLTFLTMAFVLLTFICCGQSADDRYQRYLEEMADTSESSMEFITPEKDSVEYVEDVDNDSWADDGVIVTVPDIPQERSVNMHSNNYDVEKMMMGKE